MTKMIPPVSTTSNTDGSDTASSLDAMAYDKAGDAARLMEIFERIVKARGESRAQFGRRAGLGKAANATAALAAIFFSIVILTVLHWKDTGSIISPSQRGSARWSKQVFKDLHTEADTHRNCHWI